VCYSQCIGIFVYVKDDVLSGLLTGAVDAGSDGCLVVKVDADGGGCGREQFSELQHKSDADQFALHHGVGKDVAKPLTEVGAVSESGFLVYGDATCEFGLPPWWFWLRCDHFYVQWELEGVWGVEHFMQSGAVVFHISYKSAFG
jgi:hypothetical protein